MELSKICVFPYQSGTIIKAPHICIISKGNNIGTLSQYPIENQTLIVTCPKEIFKLVLAATRIIHFAGICKFYIQSFKNHKSMSYKDYGSLLISILNSVSHNNLINASKQMKSKSLEECKIIAQNTITNL